MKGEIVFYDVIVNKIVPLPSVSRYKVDADYYKIIKILWKVY